jgi:hypothetical protein
VDDFYEYEYETMWMTSMCMSMRQCGSTMCVNVYLTYGSHIVYVVRQCGWQYCVCGDEFVVCDNYMFFCVVTHGEK